MWPVAILLGSEALDQQFPTFLAPGLAIWNAIFPWTWWRRDDFGMIQTHYTYCAVYFYYYHITSTPDHQALDPRAKTSALDHQKEAKNH